VVILFSIDGMRPDGLQMADTPAIDDAIANGASTMRAQTVMPCCTLPCHTSMHRGVDATRHGVMTNTFQPIVRPVPSVFDVANAAGLRCGFFYNWGPLRDLCDPESLVVSRFYRDAHRPDGDTLVAESARQYIRKHGLDFAFVYLGYTDECGHANGWMSKPYIDAITNADWGVQIVLDAAPDATVLIMSDHGGHDRTHGTLAPEDMTIPFILSGPGIKPGVTIERDVVIYDAAPTLARLLELNHQREWDGRVIGEAFS
jgi:predicted AlkP superfamily pyrophosphatase or phosphodiesterase